MRNVFENATSFDVDITKWTRDAYERSRPRDHVDNMFTGAPTRGTRAMSIHTPGTLIAISDCQTYGSPSTSTTIHFSPRINACRGFDCVCRRAPCAHHLRHGHLSHRSVRDATPERGEKSDDTVSNRARARGDDTRRAVASDASRPLAHRRDAPRSGGRDCSTRRHERRCAGRAGCGRPGVSPTRWIDGRTDIRASLWTSRARRVRRRKRQNHLLRSTRSVPRAPRLCVCNQNFIVSFTSRLVVVEPGATVRSPSPSRRSDGCAGNLFGVNTRV